MIVSEMDPLIQQAATVYVLPFALLKAQCEQESSYRPDAFRYEHDFYRRYIVGNKDAKAAQYGPLAACSYGLLQIVLEVAYELGYDGRPEGLFVDRVGLAWGAKKMRALWAKVGGTDADYFQALCMYNGGTGGNLKAPFRNRDYAERVYHRAGV
jgi:hypothetical protein